MEDCLPNATMRIGVNGVWGASVSRTGFLKTGEKEEGKCEAGLVSGLGAGVGGGVETTGSAAAGASLGPSPARRPSPCLALLPSVSACSFTSSQQNSESSPSGFWKLGSSDRGEVGLLDVAAAPGRPRDHAGVG